MIYCPVCSFGFWHHVGFKFCEPNTWEGAQPAPFGRFQDGQQIRRWPGSNKA